MPPATLCDEPFEEPTEGVKKYLERGVNWTEMHENFPNSSKQRCQMAVLQYRCSDQSVARRWTAERWPSVDALKGTYHRHLFADDEITVLRAFNRYGFSTQAVSEELHYRTAAECGAKVIELRESGELFKDTPVVQPWPVIYYQ
jgi:hypothetical protein